MKQPGAAQISQHITGITPPPPTHSVFFLQLQVFFCIEVTDICRTDDEDRDTHGFPLCLLSYSVPPITTYGNEPKKLIP
jgi:hypothetical protein